MYRFRINHSDSSSCIQYGVPQATALTTGYGARSVYFISENHIYHSTLPEFDESKLSPVEKESPIINVEATEVGSVCNPIQCITSVRREDRHSCFIGIIDNKGLISIYEDTENNFSFLHSFQHPSSTSFGLEESWSLISFSPSGKRFFALHGLSDSISLFDLSNENKPCVLYTVGHPYSACWRDEETIVVAENKQLSQYYAMSGRECTAFNRISVGTNPIRVVCSFKESDDIIACSETDRGVFGLNARSLKIVTRWKAPIRNMVVGAVSETTYCEDLGGKVNIAYFCGDDNEVLMYNCNGKEEKDGALKERHTINIRSRSRIIGMTLATVDHTACLFVLGQNGDLDVITNPCTYMMERRKRKREEGKESVEKRMENDD